MVDALFSQYQSKGLSVNSNNLNDLLDKLFSDHLNLTLNDIANYSRIEILEVCQPVDFCLEKDYVDRTLQQGVTLFEKLGFVGNSYIDIYNVNIPDFILGDNSLYSSSGTTLEDYESRYFNMTRYHDHLKNFAEACIV